jgi:hypothetical protein
VRRVAALALALTLAAPAAAQNANPPAASSLTVGTLLEQCTGEAAGAREACATFILKALQANREAAEPAFCPTPGTVLGDARARFIVWATVHAEFHASPAAAGVAAALAEAFPCPLTQSG